MTDATDTATFPVPLAAMGAMVSMAALLLAKSLAVTLLRRLFVLKTTCKLSISSFRVVAKVLAGHKASKVFKVIAVLLVCVVKKANEANAANVANKGNAVFKVNEACKELLARRVRKESVVRQVHWSQRSRWERRASRPHRKARKY